MIQGKFYLTYTLMSEAVLIIDYFQDCVVLSEVGRTEV